MNKAPVYIAARSNALVMRTGTPAAVARAFAHADTLPLAERRTP
jgi:hypothetical protein